ncbi:MAG: tRNA pseudouridine(38-40) synthase TruA [Eubacteriales bacterium]|jgi:tRNA pseudouridine38-40 synthase|nr:tRNA pseudouridine(38-40) synthase TruA [Eubacteriales bacterium]
MRNVLIRIEYDGTAFYGWQRQPGRRTVQGELERVLSVLCGGNITIDGTGRTDAGVHALGQCATFSGEFSIPADRIPRAANGLLAENRMKQGDIRILSAEDVPAGFHARKSAVGKTYIYRIYNAKNMPVFLRNYRYNVKKQLNTDAMIKAASFFTGTRDYSSFMTASDDFRGSTVKTVHAVNIREEGRDISIAVTGSGFLYNMVRIMAGTLVDIGTGRIPADRAVEIAAACDRSAAGHTAPAQGLYMAEVYFSTDDLVKGTEKY